MIATTRASTPRTTPAIDRPLPAPPVRDRETPTPPRMTPSRPRITPTSGMSQDSTSPTRPQTKPPVPMPLPPQLLAEVGREALLELPDRGGVDVTQPVAAGVVQRGRAHLLEQLLDHRADPHDLGRLLDHVAEARRAVLADPAVLGHGHRADRPA